jgi:hypothetical protein
MPRRALALGLIAFGLTLVPSAQAKEAITRLRICGASQCTTIAGLTKLEILMTDIGDESVAPPHRAPFYTMRPEKTREWPATWPHYVYVPSSNAVQVTMGNGDRYWDSIAFELSAPLLREATRDLKPNPTPEAWSTARAAFQVEGKPDRISWWKWLAGGALAVIVVLLAVQRTRRLRHEPRAPAPDHQ